MLVHQPPRTSQEQPNKQTNTQNKVRNQASKEQHTNTKSLSSRNQACCTSYQRNRYVQTGFKNSRSEICCHISHASAAMHTSATKSMLFLMSRNVLTSPSVENKTCKDNACRDRLAHLCRKTMCAGQSNKACAKESTLRAQKRQGQLIKEALKARCLAARPSAKG